MTRRKDGELSLAVVTTGMILALVVFWAPLPAQGPLLFEAPTAQPLEQSAEPAADTAESATVEPDEPARPPLSPEMAALGGRTRRAVAQLYSRRPNTRDNTPDQIINFCLAFGASAEVAAAGSSNRSINAVGSLCWNYPCGGYQLLRQVDDRCFARVGYSLQRRPGQMLAMLAHVGVPADYEIRIGDHRATVADLVESEKKDCRAGSNLSFKLTGLSFYLDPEDTWTDSYGGEWSLERLLSEEFDRTTNRDSVDVVDRLVGLSIAADRLDDAPGEMQELVQRVRKHVTEYQEYSRELQNTDGSWHPGFFAYRGKSKDSVGSLHSTGHILAWLVDSLPEEELDDPRIVRGIEYLARAVSGHASRRGMSSLSTKEIDAVMHAARALTLYDVRYLTPRSPAPPASTVPE